MDELTSISALNRALEQAAAEGDWPRVSALDEERTRLLVALPVSDEPALRAVVEDALGVTKALLAQAVDARESVGSELRGLHRGQRGASAYQRGG